MTHARNAKTLLGELMESWREEVALTQKDIGKFFTPPTTQATWSQYVYGRATPSEAWMAQFEELSGRSLSKAAKKTKPAPTPAPEPEPEPEPSPQTGTGLRMWEWIARTTERYDEPEEVKQSSSLTSLTWPSFQRNAKVRLLLSGGSRVTSVVMEAHVQLVRNERVVKSARLDQVASAHRMMDEFFKEASKPQPGLDLLLKGIIAICAVAQYQESKP